MAQQVLGVVGAGIGWFIGGPAGAQWGWAIGSTIGAAVDPQTIRGPRIGDIARQTSQEGISRPIIFAQSPPIAGNVIATSEPRTVRRRSSGKGGPKVETESVYRTYAIGIGEGPITRFSKIWRNGILVYDVDTLDLEGIAASIIALLTGNNQSFVQTARFFLGTYDQNPSPDLEAIFGVGTTPAHRGTAYMVMADEDLTDMRGAIPQWTFQVERCAESASPALVMITEAENVALGDPFTITCVSGSFLTSETRIAEIDGTYQSAFVHGSTICGKGNLLLATGLISTTQYFAARSEDGGISWSLTNFNPAIGFTYRPFGVMCSPAGMFVTWGERNENNNDWLLYSSDGYSFQECVITDLGTNDYRFTIVAYVEALSRFFAAGYRGICSSEDGITWTARLGSITNFNGLDFAYSADANLLVCMRLNSYRYSTDGGLTWSATVSPVAFVDASNNSLAFGNGVWVVTTTLGVTTSTDPTVTTSWTADALPAGMTQARRVIFDGTRFVLVGSSSLGNSVIYTSETGLAGSWTQEREGDVPARINFVALAYP